MDSEKNYPLSMHQLSGSDTHFVPYNIENIEEVVNRLSRESKKQLTI